MLKNSLIFAIAILAIVSAEETPTKFFWSLFIPASTQTGVTPVTIAPAPSASVTNASVTPVTIAPAPSAPVTNASVTPVTIAPAPSTPVTNASITITPVPTPMPPAARNCSEGEIYRENCNICICDPSGPRCSTIDCDSLPEEVKMGNAVADSDLPKLPASDNDAVVGQVYKDELGYYCVAAMPNEIKCYD